MSTFEDKRIKIPFGVTIKQGSAGGGCRAFLRKKWWLRLFHTIMLQDTNEYLLDPFGSPVSFNRWDLEDDFLNSLRYSIIHGYDSSACNDDLRVRVELTASLDKLILCPWIYGKSTEVEVTQGKQYRLGYEKTKSTLGEYYWLFK